MVRVCLRLQDSRWQTLQGRQHATRSAHTPCSPPGDMSSGTQGKGQAALTMWGMTPPPAMVALMRVSSSSSPRIASCTAEEAHSHRSLRAA